MLRQIPKIIGKNLKLLLRSRSSALIFIFGPLFLIMLVGFAFNSVGTSNVDIGIYSDDYSTTTLSFVKEIADGPFRTLRFDSEAGCIENIKKGTISACVVFPKDLNVKDTRVDEIIFHVDYSRINIVWQILDRIKKQLSQASDTFSLDLTNNLIITMNDVVSKTKQTYPLLTDSKTQNQQLIQNIEDVSLQMNSIDLALESGDFGLVQSKEDIGSLKHKVGTMYNNVDRMFKKAKELNDQGLSQALLCVDDDDAREALRNDLDFDQVSVFMSEANEAYDETIQKINQSFSSIIDVEVSVEQLDTRLKVNDDLRSEIQDNLSETVSFVGVNNQNLDLISNKLDSIGSLVGDVEQKNAENIVKPVATNIRPVIPETTNLVYLFPNLITLVALFMSVLLAATIIVTEKSSTAYFRNFISPSRDINFIIGSYVTNLLLMAVQMIIILSVADYYFKTDIISNVRTISLIVFLLVTVFALIGMFVGYLLNSQDTVTIGAIVVSSIMLFLSDLIMPLENMPGTILKLAKYNPFIIGSDLLKKAVLFGRSYSEISSGLWTLVIYAIVLFILVMLVQSAVKKQKIGLYANKYLMKREHKKWRRFVAFSTELEDELEKK